MSAKQCDFGSREGCSDATCCQNRHKEAGLNCNLTGSRRFVTFLTRNRAALAQALFLTLASLVCVPQDNPQNAYVAPGAARPSTDAGLGPRNGGNRPLKVEVNLVLVPVTVTDEEERLVLGLGKESFGVYEGRNQQVISHFSTQDAPISLGVIFDTSSSMTQEFELTREAIGRFLRSSSPQDEFFLLAANKRPGLLVDFTSSVEEVQSEVAKAKPSGTTALLDAVYMSLNQMKKAKYERKVLLIVSDGKDNHSRFTTREVLSLVKEAGVQIYAIGILDGIPKSKANRMGLQLLATITDVTGGRTFPIRNPKGIQVAAVKLATELRNQYLIAYRPSDLVHDGRWRKISVRVAPPKNSRRLRVYAKTGYYAPAQ